MMSVVVDRWPSGPSVVVVSGKLILLKNLLHYGYMYINGCTSTCVA